MTERTVYEHLTDWGVERGIPSTWAATMVLWDRERAEVIAALRALVDHPGYFLDGLGEFECPYCEGRAPLKQPIPHAEDCPIRRGRAILARLSGEE